VRFMQLEQLAMPMLRGIVSPDARAA
jgi:hypothetical protein